MSNNSTENAFDNSSKDIAGSNWKRMQEVLGATLDADPDELMDGELANYAKRIMSLRLEEKRKNGRGGWWTNTCSTEVLREMLSQQMQNMESANMVDIMNLAAMISYREGANIKHDQ